LLDKTYRVPYEHWSVASSILSNAHTPPQVERNSSGVFGTFNSPQFLHEEEVGWTVPSEKEPQSPVWFVEEYGTDTMFLARTQKQADGVAVALERAGVLFKTQNSMDREGWGGSGDSDMSTRTGLYNALQKLSELGPNDFNTTTGLSRYANGSGRDPAAIKLRPPEVAAILDHASATALAQSRDSTTSKIESIEDTADPVTAEELNQYVKDSFWNTYTSGAASVSKLNKTGYHTENLRSRDQQALPPALTRNDAPVDGVETKVYTIHASKGTEASNVVVWDGVTKRIQTGTENDQATLENEWRTWYVALTRASKRLFVGRGGFDWMNSWLPGSLKEQAEEATKNEAEA
jgi:DNA helicase-2/ATP-dependent DNA helicase PcrA